jgi:hypothetical protein
MIDGGSPLDATSNSSTDAGDSINAQVEHLLQYSNKDLTLSMLLIVSNVVGSTVAGEFPRSVCWSFINGT